MNLHDADLARRLKDFLDRRQPPKSFAGNERARDEQIAAYLTILRRKAPQGDTLSDWWGRFLEALSEASETWAWPSEKDVWIACKNAAGSRTGPAGDTWKPDAVAINLARIERGELVGEFWLWGRGALQLLAAGADRNVLRERRLAHAEALAEMYEPEKVREILAALRVKHEGAQSELQEAQRHKREMPEVSIRRAFTRQQLEDLIA